MSGPGPALAFFWFIDLDFATRFHHGATLRYLNYSRELVALDHRVYFLVQLQPGEIEAGRKFFSELKQQGTFTDFFECAYASPRWKGRWAKLVILPWLANRLLASSQLPLIEYSKELAAKLGVDVCIFSNRRMFFLVSRFVKMLPSIVDFGDSATLYRFREARFMWRSRNVPGLLTSFRYLIESYLQERSCGRLAHALVVSRVDKSALDRVTGRSERNHVLLNGVSIPKRAANVQKIARRLIFSGNMNFPPNYQAAIWFIDKVFPLVSKAHPQAHLIVAGANPIAGLLARATTDVRIIGFVEDMDSEIAVSSLYVAPLITGSGFKNKVIEALANRTYVAATRVALEFLDAGMIGKILVGDSAESLADRINEFLLNPEQFEERLTELHSMVLSEFSWANRAKQLLSIAEQIAAESASRPALIS